MGGGNRPLATAQPITPVVGAAAAPPTGQAWTAPQTSNGPLSNAQSLNGSTQDTGTDAYLNNIIKYKIPPGPEAPNGVLNDTATANQIAGVVNQYRLPGGGLSIQKAQAEIANILSEGALNKAKAYYYGERGGEYAKLQDTLDKNGGTAKTMNALITAGYNPASLIDQSKLQEDIANGDYQQAPPGVDKTSWLFSNYADNDAVANALKAVADKKTDAGDIKQIKKDADTYGVPLGGFVKDDGSFDKTSAQDAVAKAKKIKDDADRAAKSGTVFGPGMQNGGNTTTGPAQANTAQTAAALWGTP